MDWIATSPAPATPARRATLDIPVPSAPVDLNFAFSAHRSVTQHTLARPLAFHGRGVHSGRAVTVQLLPAAVDHGIRFFRSDLHNGARLIVPSAHQVDDTRLCTTLINQEGSEIGTVEHVLAALHGAGVSNCLIDIDGPELPILDGSSHPFTTALSQVGLQDQAAPQTYLKILRPVEVRDGERVARLSPASGGSDTRLTLNFAIDFDAACIGHQTFTLDLTPESFATQVSAARTFGFVEQIDTLRRQGLIRGASDENAIVVRDGTVQNPEGLRFPDEFVRHKVLDAVGDLFIEGIPLIGIYDGIRAGHEMTNRVMRALMADPQNTRLINV